MWLSGQPQSLAGAVTRSIRPAGPRRYTGAPNGALTEPRQESGMLGSANRVMQLVGHPALVQILEMRHERGDADAAGDEQVLARDLVEREQIHGMGDFDPCSALDLIVHEMRSAARFLHAAHADLVGVERMRRTQQRIGVAIYARGR